MREWHPVQPGGTHSLGQAPHNCSGLHLGAAWLSPKELGPQG